MRPPELASPAPLTALAALRPCQLYAYHQPRPTRTQGHHRYPVYLQNRVFGRIALPELLWLCGTCHDSVHDWISWLLGEARKPDPEPGRLAKTEARRTVDWYLQEMAAREPTPPPAAV